MSEAIIKALRGERDKRYTPFSRYLISGDPARPGSKPRPMDDPRMDYIEGKRQKPRDGGGGY